MLNEMVAPACSLSNGHASSTDCSFQETVPGIETGAITSAYCKIPLPSGMFSSMSGVQGRFAYRAVR